MQTEETTGAGTRSANVKRRFTAKRLAVMAVFSALAYVISFMEFSIFPSSMVAFLKLDFSNTFILLTSFLLGPIEGIVVCAVKEGLRLFTSGTGGIGELANFLVTSSYILLPSIVYQFRKRLQTVCVTLAIACLIGTAVALVTNRFIMFPLYAELLLKYYGVSAEKAFSMSWGLILAFNVIKTVSVSVLTLLLYKRLSNFLKKWKI